MHGGKRWSCHLLSQDRQSLRGSNFSPYGFSWQAHPADAA
ncbi:Uncharacterised protein [Vibrio cholerae]|nr:Uncharacterised protein [Vibrio cholerae]